MRTYGGYRGKLELSSSSKVSCSADWLTRTVQGSNGSVDAPSQLETPDEPTETSDESTSAEPSALPSTEPSTEFSTDPPEHPGSSAASSDPSSAQIQLGPPEGCATGPAAGESEPQGTASGVEVAAALAGLLAAPLVAWSLYTLNTTGALLLCGFYCPKAFQSPSQLDPFAWICGIGSTHSDSRPCI